MSKRFGIYERILKWEIPFTNIIVTISKSHPSFTKLYIKFKKASWYTNTLSVLEGNYCIYDITIGRDGTCYDIDFTIK